MKKNNAPQIIRYNKNRLGIKSGDDIEVLKATFDINFKSGFALLVTLALLKDLIQSIK